MTAKEDAQLSMCNAVKLHCTKNLVLLSGNAVFVSSFNAFKAAVDGIFLQLPRYMQDDRGVAAQKKAHRNGLEIKADYVSMQLQSVAAILGDEDLKLRTKFTPTRLLQARELELVGIVEVLVEEALGQLPALAAAGIDIPYLTAMAAEAKVFAKEIGSPASKIKDKQKSTLAIRDFLKEALELLKEQMDKLMSIWKTTNPDVYNTYFKCRKIVNPSYNKPRVKGSITDSETGKPLHGVSLFLDNNKTSFKNTLRGNFRLLEPKPGKHKLRLVKHGYHTQIVPFDLKEGVVCFLAVVLIRN